MDSPPALSFCSHLWKCNVCPGGCTDREHAANDFLQAAWTHLVTSTHVEGPWEPPALATALPECQHHLPGVSADKWSHAGCSPVFSHVCPTLTSLPVPVAPAHGVGAPVVTCHPRPTAALSSRLWPPQTVLATNCQEPEAKETSSPEPPPLFGILVIWSLFFAFVCVLLDSASKCLLNLSC